MTRMTAAQIRHRTCQEEGLTTPLCYDQAQVYRRSYERGALSGAGENN